MCRAVVSGLCMSTEVQSPELSGISQLFWLGSREAGVFCSFLLGCKLLIFGE